LCCKGHISFFDESFLVDTVEVTKKTRAGAVVKKYDFALSILAAGQCPADSPAPTISPPKQNGKKLLCALHALDDCCLFKKTHKWFIVQPASQFAGS